jgi:hypothetical protein
MALSSCRGDTVCSSIPRIRDPKNWAFYKVNTRRRNCITPYNVSRKSYAGVIQPFPHISTVPQQSFSQPIFQPLIRTHTHTAHTAHCGDPLHPTFFFFSRILKVDTAEKIRQGLHLKTKSLDFENDYCF